jgi:hypothetical protein
MAEINQRRFFRKPTGRGCYDRRRFLTEQAPRHYRAEIRAADPLRWGLALPSGDVGSSDHDVGPLDQHDFTKAHLFSWKITDIHETDFLTKFNIIHEQWYMQLYNLATLCNPGNNIAAIQYIIQQKTSCHDVSWLSSPFNRLEFYMPRVTMLAMWDFVNMDQFVWK